MASAPHTRGGLLLLQNRHTPFRDVAALSVDVPYTEPEYRTTDMENPLLTSLHGFSRADSAAARGESKRTNHWGWIG